MPNELIMAGAAIGAVVVCVAMYAWLVYNRFVSLGAHCNEAWAGIQVELKRRYDLIPNLVETVRGYAAHERDLLERVASLRNRAMANTGSPSAQSGDEVALEAGVRAVVALSEAYPDLKADGLFRELHAELVDTEDRIAATRRFYNGNVRELNQLAGQFPSRVIASWFGFAPREYFELADPAESAPPRL
jgi:LemA protein